MSDSLVPSGLPAVDARWGGLSPDGAYLLVGRADGGRSALALQFARGAVDAEARCLLISPRAPDDLVQLASAVGLDLGDAHRTGRLRLLRIPTAEAFAQRGSDGLDTVYQEFVTLVRTDRPDRVVIEDFTPLVQFDAFDRFEAAFSRLVSDIGSLKAALVVGLGEPANATSLQLVEVIRRHVNGSIELDGESRRIRMARHEGASLDPDLPSSDLPSSDLPGADAGASSASLPDAPAPEEPSDPPLPPAVPAGSDPSVAFSDPSVATPDRLDSADLYGAPATGGFEPPGLDRPPSPVPAEPEPASPVPVEFEPPTASAPPSHELAEELVASPETPPPSPAPTPLSFVSEGEAPANGPAAGAPPPPSGSGYPVGGVTAAPPADPSLQGPAEDRFNLDASGYLGHGYLVDSGAIPPPPRPGETPPAFTSLGAASPPDPIATFRAALDRSFAVRVSGTPFLVVAVRMEASAPESVYFPTVADGLRAALRSQDRVLIDEDRRRAVVLLPASQGDAAQTLFAGLQEHLHRALGESAPGVLRAVGAVSVPDGQPFTSSRDLMAYAYED